MLLFLLCDKAPSTTVYFIWYCYSTSFVFLGYICNSKWNRPKPWGQVAQNRFWL